jgi:dipeptidyl aminopeptidase/acylaminoacyl peptidase
VRTVLATCLAAAVLACAGPRFELSDLPMEPVAIVYRTVEESDRVLDMFQQEQKEKRDQRFPGGSGRFQVELEKVEQLAGRRGDDEVVRDQLGRLALFEAPTGAIDVADFAPRGARPLQWSADRQRLLFSAPSRKNHHLFEWNAERREVRQVTRGRWSYADGCYGPDGSIAWVELARPKGQPPSSRIWIRRPGEAARPLTEGPADGQPAWSPRGDRLVYVRIGGARREWLHWIDPRTGEGGALTRGRSPTFTPDGAWIVYTAKTRDTWKLWRMHADGSSRLRFGASPFHENDPSVSPDGRFVAYAGSKQERSAMSRLFVRPLDGSPDRQLELSGSGLIPVW